MKEKELTYMLGTLAHELLMLKKALCPSHETCDLNNIDISLYGCAGCKTLKSIKKVCDLSFDHDIAKEFLNKS
jgi:hypothetical protein